ncbi:MAG: PAS domain-containing protein [Bdellovibrionales bacterium]|nr:PAS domain-containing protein [Bdellovibrionales bacterium]
MRATTLYRSVFPTLLLLALGVVAATFLLVRNSVFSVIEAEYGRDLISHLQSATGDAENENELRSALIDFLRHSNSSVLVVDSAGEEFFRGGPNSSEIEVPFPLQPRSEEFTVVRDAVDSSSLPYLEARTELFSRSYSAVLTAPFPLLVQVSRGLYGAAFIAIGGALLLALLFSSLVIAPVKQGLSGLLKLARRVGSADASSFVGNSSLREIQEVAVRLERVSRDIEAHMDGILNEKNETDAVLSSMAEGVIAIDSNERIIRMNGAAMDVFDLELHPKTHPSVQEAIRNTDFLKLVKKVLSSHHPIEGEITLLQDGEKILHVNATPLRNTQADLIGALLVFHDITNLRKLETMRRDFVANVSHELKTPITSIKGFVETLLDGALDNNEDAKRFLGIVLKQSDRLTSIIDDLLSLSRLESDQKNSISFDATDVGEVIHRACQTCESEAQRKGIRLKIEALNGLHTRANGHLLEQAVINLLSNAIKYSHEQNDVIVRVNADEHEIRLSVEDFGIGIPKIHIPRLFERFYRVDKARSRKMGGTGLGLAITKHIAQLHNGFVSVKSTPGQGSVFTLHLPFERSVPKQVNSR